MPRVKYIKPIDAALFDLRRQVPDDETKAGFEATIEVADHDLAPDRHGGTPEQALNWCDHERRTLNSRQARSQPNPHDYWRGCALGLEQLRSNLIKYGADPLNQSITLPVTTWAWLLQHLDSWVEGEENYREVEPDEAVMKVIRGIATERIARVR